MGDIVELGAFGNLVVGVTTFGDVTSSGTKPAWLSSRANGLVDVGHISAALVGAESVPALEPGLANGDVLSAVSC